MNEKKDILNKINSFKNKVIKSNTKDILSPKKKNNETNINNKININLIYVNNSGNQGPRNSTAPNKNNKRVKGNIYNSNNKHLKIEAKNKELEKIYLDNHKLSPKKISTKSLSKAKINNNKNNTIKRINSSNNIKNIDNYAVDYFTQLLEGSEIIKNNNTFKNNNNCDSNSMNNITSEIKLENLRQNNQMGLFSIHFHSNIKEFDNMNNIMIKNNYNSNDKTMKFENNNNKTPNSNKILNNKKMFNNVNMYKLKHSSSIESETNKLVIKNNKEIKKYNNIINNEYKNTKTIKNASINKYSHILENEKNENRNKTNKPKNQNNNNKYQYLILKGNASFLIKYCMHHRINWVEATNPEPNNPDYASNIFNFKWKELSYGIDYHNLSKDPKMKQIVNHFEFHYAISNKANMFMNLMKYCEKRNISVFKYVPFTIVFKLKDRRKIKNKEKQKRWNEKLEKLKNFIQDIDKNVKHYDNIGSYYSNKEYIEDREKRYEFEKMKQNKKEAKKSKEEEKEKEKDKNKTQEKLPEEKYNGKYEVYSDIFPRLKFSDKPPKKKQTEEKEKEKKIPKIIGSNTLIEIPHTHFIGRNMWVIKAVNLNRGMCIKVVNSFEQMEKVINKFKTGVDYSNFTIEKIEEDSKEDDGQEILIEDKSKDTNINEGKFNQINENEENNMNENIKKEDKKNSNEGKENDNDKEEKIYNCNKIVIQKYIENPLLYKGRKCDMRIWVLLTHQMKVYLFKEGHLKTCSVEYDVNSKDAFTHITNYSFQKYNSNFQKFEKGNEVPFYEFQKFIDEKYPTRNYKLNKDLMKQIKEIIGITMRCGKNIFNRNNRNYQFEIFGYDFMLDSDFNAFLIEINTNPGLEISSPWIQIVVPRMLDDALRLTLDKVFEPVYDFTKNYKGDYTPEQKKLLFENKIAYDFNAVNPIFIKNEKEKDMDKEKDVVSLTSSTFSYSSKPQINKSNNIFDINLDLDEFDKKLLKEEQKDNCFNKDVNDIINANNEIDIVKKEENKCEKNIEENKCVQNNKKNNNKLKYKSPFPVPGYSLEENLWDFICDLNGKDPYEINKDKNEKENTDKNSFTGIRHLLKKRSNKPKKEKDKK